MEPREKTVLCTMLFFSFGAEYGEEIEGDGDKESLATSLSFQKVEHYKSKIKLTLLCLEFNA